jgi:hypothetical protein
MIITHGKEMHHTNLLSRMFQLRGAQNNYKIKQGHFKELKDTDVKRLSGRG